MPDGARARQRVVFVGSHLGYPMDETPLGGGAMVGLQLVRHWAGRDGLDLTVLGSGPQAPDPRASYVRLPPGAGARWDGIVRLSEFEYARFCREFESATTGWLMERRSGLESRRTCVIVNDISEGPTLAVLARAGFPIVSLWHVDVLDYFNKLYLGHLFGPERWARLYEGARRLGAGRALPDVLRLVFEKQRETVVHSRRMLLPSRAMAETVRRCYGGLLGGPARFAERALVVPWGAWPAPPPGPQTVQETQRLRDHYQIGPGTTVLMTLSRISPEKGLHLLMEALLRLERKGAFRDRDVCLLVCGEPAFMQGEAYLREVRGAAAALRTARVFFPGYLAAAEKSAYFRLAHLFISPSIHESYGLNIVEAMQAGLPILASDHYGVRDLLDDSFGRVARFPSPAKAAAPLADALEGMLSDPERLSRMGRSAAEAAARMPFSRAAEIVLKTALDLSRDDRPQGALR